MMKSEALIWIDGQAPAMAELVERLANINSHSLNLAGLERMAQAAAEAFSPLEASLEYRDLPAMRAIDDHGEVITQPLGRAMVFTKRPEAPRQVLLAIHLDTVYPADGPFQKAVRQGNTLRGPGVADAKGGLVVMLTALRALELDPAAKHLGYRVILNPDEEIGSPGSAGLFRELAAGGGGGGPTCPGKPGPTRCDAGLVFEPTLPDGSLVSSRGGSGRYTLVVRGKAAHVGRDYASGRSAIRAMAEAVGMLESINNAGAGLIVNVGQVRGGGPVNVVPAMAIARMNVRFVDSGQQAKIEEHIRGVVEYLKKRDGIEVMLHGGATAPAKPLDEGARRMLDVMLDCGEALGLKLTHRHTGGVCDGNRMAAAGLPTLDTLGPRGDGLHSDRETLYLDSLAERAKLTAMFLMRLARDDIRIV